MAKEPARILSLLRGQTPSFIKNSAPFVEIIEQVHIEEQDQMASYDVVSLFTKVPIDEALQTVSSALLADDTLQERTSVPPSEICNLVEICLCSNFFQVRDMFYEQVGGTAMGSPLSPRVAGCLWKLSKNRSYQLRKCDRKFCFDMWRIYLRFGVMERNNYSLSYW